MLTKIVGVIASITAFFGAAHSPVANVPAITQAAAAFASLPAGVTDTITITNASGVAVTNYPFQFGRPFVQGEIPHYPQVLVNGTSIPTQADIKNKYPDGSIKFAVISIIIPSIPASGSISLSIADQASGSNVPLTTAQMMANGFDFDASINLTQSGVTKSADARTMLANGDYTYWAAGPIATTIILEDNSASRKYDIGFDSLRSVHPKFIATFWPAMNKVQVRVIGLDANITALEDVTAGLAIKLGSASPQTLYTNLGLTTYAGTAWNKTFWINGAPEKQINEDFNIAYLSATKYLPNFDPSLKSAFTPTIIAARYSNWLNKKAIDLYQNGFWDKSMGDTGGRPDIGIEPGWMMDWLYTGNWRDRTIALGQADLADAWKMQAVEGTPTAKYDRAQTIPALGLPISIFAHPQEWLFDPRGIQNTITITQESVAHPSLTGNTSNGGLAWQAEAAHEPDPFSVPYILTGDPWYLSELQMWAATDVLKTPVNISSTPLHSPIRMSSPVIAAFNNQIRGDAWALRNRAYAGFLSPDGSPQQNYFNDVVNDMIAGWEAVHKIPNPVLAKTSAYQKLVQTSPLDPPEPMHYFVDAGRSATQFDTTVFVHGATIYVPAWQQNYFMIVLGTLRDMGYPTQGLLSWMSFTLTDFFNFASAPANGVDPRFVFGVFDLPEDAANTPPLFTTWREMINELVPAKYATQLNAAETGTGDYTAIAGGAAAQIANLPGGAAVWAFADTFVQHNPVQLKQYISNNSPGWDILPRSITSIPLPPPVITPPAPPPPPTATTTPPGTTTPPVKPPVITPPGGAPPPATTSPSGGNSTGTISYIAAMAVTSNKTNFSVGSSGCSDPSKGYQVCNATIIFTPHAAGKQVGVLKFDRVYQSGTATVRVVNYVSLSGNGVMGATNAIVPENGEGNLFALIWDAKRSAEFFFQNMGMRLALAFSGGSYINLASVIAPSLTSSMNFPDTTVGTSFMRHITITINTSGVMTVSFPITK